VARGLARAEKGSVGKRPRTVYTISEAGRRALAAWLAEPGTPARIALVLVTAGRVDGGIKHLDEAMAAATAGESRTLESVGETCCT
jgi:DNA-binding PadR family transcriptional regulator